jgi:plastocyanin
LGMLLNNTGGAQQLAYSATLFALALIVLLTSAATAGAQKSQEVVTVAIRDLYFEPSRLIVEPGTMVRWVNEGAIEHTVLATSPAGAFRSETLSPGESFTHTFPQRFPARSPDSSTKPGTYEYLCEIHPTMKGSVTFSESGEAPTRGREDPTIQQPPTTLPGTGGLNPGLLIGLLVAFTVLGGLGWAVKRYSS